MRKLGATKHEAAETTVARSGVSFGGVVRFGSSGNIFRVHVL